MSEHDTALNDQLDAAFTAATRHPGWLTRLLTLPSDDPGVVAWMRFLVGLHQDYIEQRTDFDLVQRLMDAPAAEK